jgi:hypothetical protein
LLSVEGVATPGRDGLLPGCQTGSHMHCDIAMPAGVNGLEWGRAQSLVQPVGVDNVQIHLQLVPVISLITGILILVMPKLLNYAIGIYLILIGLVGITGMGQL